MSIKKIERKESMLTEEEQRILEACAIYMPKKAVYNYNGEIDGNAEKIDEIKGELRDVQKNTLDSEMKRRKITELKQRLCDAEDKRRISKKNFNLMAFEIYKQDYMPSSRKDTFWRNVKDVEKILSKSHTFNNLILKDTAVRRELIVLYYILISVMPLINHNHQKTISAYNEKIANDPYYIKEATPPKVISQLKFDIARTEYCFNKDKYCKGQYLVQNYQEIEADRNLFECLVDALKIVKESNTTESFIIGLVQIILSYSFDQGIKNIAKFDSKSNQLLLNKSSYLKELDVIIEKWTEDQDLVIRKIILELFDLKIVPEIAKSIIHDSKKMEELNLSYLNIEKMSTQELQRYIDLDCDRLKRTELEDKLSSLGRIDSYFKKLCDEKRKELWGI